MKRKVLVSILITIVIVITYLGYQYYWLSKTDKLPYSNLLYNGTGSCYVSFNIECKDSIFTVVMPNEIAMIFVREKSNFLYHIYPWYMNEVIAHDMAIKLNDTLFAYMPSHSVDLNLVNKLMAGQMIQDTAVFKHGNVLRYDIPLAQENAIIYLFLKNGSNCCVHDISGVTMVTNMENIEKFINKSSR